MSDLTEKFKEYEDFELAFLFKYQKSNFLDTTLKKIEDEINSRNLNSKDINFLINRKLKVRINNHKLNVCPRCTSEKIISSREESDTQENVGLYKYKPEYFEHRTCGVCGWDFAKDFTKFDKRKILKIFLISIFISIVFTLLFRLLLKLPELIW